MSVGHCQTAARWVLPSLNGIDSLHFEGSIVEQSLGNEEVAVRLHAASLNYRDIIVAKSGVPGNMSLPNIKPDLIPCSDGAGIVTAVGSKVTGFRPGDRVITSICPPKPNDRAPKLGSETSSGLGRGADGTLRRHAHFHQTALIKAHSNVLDEEAATLTCSGLTAWNAVFGVKGREVKSANWVLVQGTGGISVTALQFAIVAGASVVATTSNDDKAEGLKRLGARHVLNYRSTPEWGAAAKELTPDSRGFDIVVDVGANLTLAQSLKAVRIDGLVVIAGMLGSADPVPLMSVLFTTCVVRGIVLGTRQQF